MRTETTTQSSFKDKSTKALKGAISKTKDVASDVLSAPKRFYEDSRAKDFNQQADDLQKARKTNKAPKLAPTDPTKQDNTDPLFRARINSINEAYDKEHTRRSQTAALVGKIKN